MNSSNAHSLTIETELLSQSFKACGDPLRVKILRVMKHDTFGVLELAQLFDTKQSGMSHHLKILNQANLIEAQREGNAIFYRRPVHFHSIADKNVARHVYRLIDCTSLDHDTLERIKLIRQQRSEQSKAFFARNVDQLTKHQELIASHHLYAPAALKLLLESVAKVGSPHSLSVMEIGPGEGLLLQDLCQHFDTVIAIDNSEDMLNKAKGANEKLSNIEFILSDTQHYKAECINQTYPKVNAVILNMVLHHVPSPSEIFYDVNQFLCDDGVMVVCDLSKHTQEWTKENCGDLWCGFDAQELNTWAKNAGLELENETYIGLRNGFQIQLRSFKKLNQDNLNIEISNDH